MSDIARYSVTEHLRDGSTAEIRALRPDDETAVLDALDHSSTQSLQRRFFGIKRHFSDKERAFFMNVDFMNHVALVCEVGQPGQTIIVGGARYIVFEPGRAELAFVVIDAWQGRGIGSILLRHLGEIASTAGLLELTAEVLPENKSMLAVLGKFGFKPAGNRDPQSVHLALHLGQEDR
ncbi:GNAT family N-acetyltransferase [Bradyrhizobium cosmicum]|uniref:GNAT family N-acetyltransferase n=1 Tax=Bradyrhizobium cosmicum TaxID=1404864 RepID=UPI0028E6ED27|nr:GNAT family N-acetyltransferase [Bradyrhizobium cosmicum]